MSRYTGRIKAINDNEMYENIFEQRAVKQIEQYTTPVLKYPNEKSTLAIRTVDYVWKQGDKFWRLADKYYGDATMWWLIAQFNKKPTEGHLAAGDVLKIPIDRGIILGALT